MSLSGVMETDMEVVEEDGESDYHKEKSGEVEDEKMCQKENIN